MSWYWKEINDKHSAEDATKAAVGISYFVAGLTGLVAVLSLVYHQRVLGMDGWSLVDAGLFAVIGWRIGRLSRGWAVAGLCIYLVEAVASIGTRGVGVGVLTIVFILAYLNAVRGAFACRKYGKTEAAQPSAAVPLG
jgi:hypothetical protein